MITPYRPECLASTLFPTLFSSSNHHYCSSRGGHSGKAINRVSMPGGGSEPLTASQVSLTEDGRRCLLHLLKSFAELQKSHLLFQALASTTVILPLQIISLTQAIYVSVTERREIARAIMEGLALTSNRLGITGNPLAVLASYFRYLVADWLGENLLSLLSNEEHLEEKPDPTLLAFACLVVALEYQLPGMPSLPERQWLQLPLSVIQLFVKARRYWSLLNDIALPARAINWRAQRGAAQLAFVVPEKSRGATRDISVNQALHRPRENPPSAPPCVPQIWGRKGVPATVLCREEPRAVDAPTPACLSPTKRAVDTVTLASQSYMTIGRR